MSADKLTIQEVKDVLAQVDAGEVTVKREGKVCANDRCQLSNGWEFVIFDDAGEWDYIARVTAPDGRALEFDDLYDAFCNYEPADVSVWGWDQ